MHFSIYGIFGQTYGGNRARLKKKGFRSLGRGYKKEAFQLKFWNLKFSFLLFSKITSFAKFSKKNLVISFLLMSGLCTIDSIQRLFDFSQCNTHNTEGTLNLISLIFGKLK